MILFRRARRVPAVGPQVRALIADLKTTMRRARGVGIAAPQIGVPLRVVLAGAGPATRALINPRVRRRWGSQTGPEGCLSIPGVVAEVRRAFGVDVEGLSEWGRPVRVRATGFQSRILQHELDHLNGVLFLDRLASGAAVRGRRDGAPTPAPAARRRA